MKKSNNLIRLVIAALLAALCCVATMAIQIPTPTGGFLNLGDAVVLLSAWTLGPVYGALAAGVGSMLADIFAGYVQYAPATFIIKAIMAVVMWTALKLAGKLIEKKAIFATLFTAVGGVAAEAVMVFGYFVFECFILRYGLGAVASVVPNIVQGTAGIIVGTILIELLKRTKIKEKFLK